MMDFRILYKATLFLFVLMQIGCKEELVSDFTISNDGCIAPCDVSFATAITGKYKSYQWDFGDGSALEDSTENPTHTYNTPGFYTVSLTAEKGKNENTATKQITIYASYPAPTADFSFVVTQTSYQHYEISYTNLSQGEAMTFVWQRYYPDSGDFITTSTSPTPPIFSATDGQYLVRLIASNFSGSDTITKNVDARPINYLYFKVWELVITDIADTSLSSYDPGVVPYAYPDVYAAASASGGSPIVCSGQVNNASLLPIVLGNINQIVPIHSTQEVYLIEVRDDDNVNIPSDGLLGSFTFTPAQLAQDSNWEYLGGSNEWVLEIPIPSNSTGLSGTIKLVFLGG